MNQSNYPLNQVMLVYKLAVSKSFLSFLASHSNCQNDSFINTHPNFIIHRSSTLNFILLCTLINLYLKHFKFWKVVEVTEHGYSTEIYYDYY